MSTTRLLLLVRVRGEAWVQHSRLNQRWSTIPEPRSSRGIPCSPMRMLGQESLPSIWSDEEPSLRLSMIVNRDQTRQCAKLSLKCSSVSSRQGPLHIYPPYRGRSHKAISLFIDLYVSLCIAYGEVVVVRICATSVLRTFSQVPQGLSFRQWPRSDVSNLPPAPGIGLLCVGIGAGLVGAQPMLMIITTPVNALVKWSHWFPWFG